MTQNSKKAVARLHDKIAHLRSVEQRMERLARLFAGLPYVVNPLGGGLHLSEKLVIKLDAFDCVTLIETALALARSRSYRGFVQELTRTRYGLQPPSYQTRLHYFSDWLRANQTRRAIRIRTKGRGSKQIAARLASLAEFRERTVRFDVVMKHKIHQARERIAHGSIVAFASVRPRLDFFHTGLLFYSDPDQIANKLLLFHASKKNGRVGFEPLCDFFSNNRMRGIAFASVIDPFR